MTSSSPPPYNKAYLKMTQDDNPHWMVRILGGAGIAVASFALLSFWDSWDLGFAIRALISLGLGTLFLVFGGNLADWIRHIDYWS